MYKKLVFGALGAVLVSTVFFGREAVSYLGTSVGWVKQSVRESIPLEFEIERARKMVKDLVPDIRKNMHLVAKEEIEVERLDDQIAQLESRLDTERAELMRLNTDLASGGNAFTYAGRSYSSDEVKVSLAHRFSRFKTQDATLASLREMRQVRQSSLEAARHKLDGMQVARRQLTLDVEQLEARLKMLEAKQTTSSYQFDDSRLSRAKGLVNDIKSRLSVEEKLTDADSELIDPIDLSSEVAPEDIVEQVTEYFRDKPEVEAAGLAAAGEPTDSL